jgi:hypothetical protein
MLGISRVSNIPLFCSALSLRPAGCYASLDRILEPWGQLQAFVEGDYCICRGFIV